MAYVVICVKKENMSKVNEVLKDDLTSRQSITARDASALDLKLDLHLVLIEGTDKGVGEPLAEKDAKQAYDKIKEEEEKASAGVGMIFDL